MGETIFFQKKGFDEFRFLSNFWHAPIVIDGEVYATVEHFYQSCKTEDSVLASQIAAALTPKIARELGQNVELIEDWDKRKVSIMRQALEAKFSQHSDLRAKLVATNGRELVEWGPWDSFWANGKDGLGKNVLGKLLTSLRHSIIDAGEIS